jgi:uncharacterized membrane protein YoaK (UPF0700 family)
VIHNGHRSVAVAERTPLEKTILVMVLPAVAGAVNGSGLFIVGAYTSHATGNLARIGDELAQGHWQTVSLCLWALMFFLVGAMLATVLLDSSQRRNKARYAWAQRCFRPDKNLRVRFCSWPSSRRWGCKTRW